MSYSNLGRRAVLYPNDLVKISPGGNAEGTVPAKAIVELVKGDLPQNASFPADPTGDDNGAYGYRLGSVWLNSSTGDIFDFVREVNGLAEWRPRAEGITLAPLQRRVAILGDSRCARSTVISTSARATTTESFATWAQNEMGGWHFDFEPDGQFGASGERTDQVLARSSQWMPWAQENRGTFIFVMGRNDNQVQLIPREQTVANLFTMRDMLLSAGCRVIMATDAPQGTAANPGAVLAGDGGQRHQWMREEILRRAGEAPGRFFVVDTWEGMTVASGNGSGIQGLDPFLIDGVHWGASGARAVGRLLIPALRSIYPEPMPILPVNNAVYDATLMPNAPRNANPMLLGTTGTLSGGATGVAPTSWTLARVGGSTDVVGSKVTDADGTEWLRISVTGTATGLGHGAQLLQTISASNYASGEQYRAACEWRVPSGNVTNIRLISLEARPTVDSQQVLVETFRQTSEAIPNAPYLRRTVVTPITPVGVVTNFSLRFNVSSAAAGLVEAVVDVRAVALRRVLT